MTTTMIDHAAGRRVLESFKKDKSNRFVHVPDTKKIDDAVALWRSLDTPEKRASYAASQAAALGK